MFGSNCKSFTHRLIFGIPIKHISILDRLESETHKLVTTTNSLRNNHIGKYVNKYIFTNIYQTFSVKLQKIT